MNRMKLSLRLVVTVLATLLVLGGFLRLSVDHRRVAISLPDAVEAPSALTR